MDLSNPLRSVAPSVEADVLGVLARTHVPLTGLRVQQLAGRSYGRVRLVLQRLVDHGLVFVEQHGNTKSYLLNRGHVLAAPLEAMVNAAWAIEDELRESVARYPIRPAALVLFGSFARRDGDAASDVDILLVRPEDVDSDDESWDAQRESLVRDLERRTGNRVQVVELSAAEFSEAVARNEPLIGSIRNDGVIVAGAVPGIRRPRTSTETW